MNILADRELGKLFLTFDIEGPDSDEDSMTPEALSVLKALLRMLDKYNLRAILFITASILAQIRSHTRIIRMMEKHEIGYHGSTHSVRPMLFEYTDVKSYEDAMKISAKRETSQFDPKSREFLDGNGGILLFEDVFPDKELVCYRAPFLCWSPPHLEALRQLGIKFDFSTGLGKTPTTFKGIAFFPSPIPVDAIPDIVFFNNYSIISTLVRRSCQVLMMHPASFIYERHNNTPRSSTQISSSIRCRKSYFYLKSRLALLELLCKGLSHLKRMGTLEVTPELTQLFAQARSVNLSEIDVEKIFATSMWAPRKLFRYEPHFLYEHFDNFFTDQNHAL